jgi:hypothetical protein
VRLPARMPSASTRKLQRIHGGPAHASDAARWGAATRQLIRMHVSRLVKERSFQVVGHLSWSHSAPFRDEISTTPSKCQIQV